jgi:hypothetical protein
MAEQADYTGGSYVPSSATVGAGSPFAAGGIPGNGGGPAAAPGGLREQVGSLEEEARCETRRIAEDARDQVAILVRRRKQLVAERLGRIAAALREAGLRLEREAGAGTAHAGGMRPSPAAPGGDPAWPASATSASGSRLAATAPAAPPAAVGLDAATRGLAELMDRAAEQVDRASDYLYENEVKDLVRDLEGFARRRPALFVGGSLAAGFLLARFLKSSGEREEGPELEEIME